MGKARRTLREIAGGQRGYVATWQLAEEGLGRRVVSSMAQSGELVRCHRGVYRVAAVPVTFEGQVLAALLACGRESGAAAAGLTSLRLQGLARAGELEADGSPISVVVEDTTPRRLTGVIVHRTVDLHPIDVTEVDGIRATTGARSLIDLQPCCSDVDLTALLDDVICARIAARAEVFRRATRLNPGRPGLRLLLELTHPEAAGIFRSWLEREFHGNVVVRFGLPAPEYNVRVEDAQGLIGVVDARWAKAAVVVELEGLRFHTTPSQRKADAERFNRLAFSPYRALRYSWRDVVERPEYVADQVARALRLSPVSRTPAQG